MPPNNNISDYMDVEIRQTFSTHECDSFTNEESPLLVSRHPTKPSNAGSRRRFLSSATTWGLAVLLIAAVTSSLFYIVTSIRKTSGNQQDEYDRERKTRVAFIGNSMMYYNDLPRLLERLSQDTMEQSSCLHGGTTLSKVLVNGNGMYEKFNTPNAFMGNDDFGTPMYDFGDCTVRQLLFGTDWALDFQVHFKDGYLEDDGTNPCLQQGRYYEYRKGIHLKERKPLHWDYIVMNDQTHYPGQRHTRAVTLQTLESTYLPWIAETNATPIFMDTHAYYTEFDLFLRDLAQSEEDIPYFTFKTYEGYTEYANLLMSHLPEWQQPRIAPVGLAFLVVWEENRDLWHKLFHCDRVHASPLGTFLTACVVHHTLFGRLPTDTTSLFLDDNNDMSELWSRARVLQEADLPPNPFPTTSEAKYLYDTARRVAVEGYRPPSFLSLWNGDIVLDEFHVRNRNSNNNRTGIPPPPIKAACFLGLH